MAERQCHLWRNYDVPPFRRFACTLVEDSSVTDGFRVVDHDPQVADGGFLSSVHDTMQRVHPIAFLGDEGRDMIRDGSPGDVDYFATAVRSVPGSYLRGEGR